MDTETHTKELDAGRTSRDARGRGRRNALSTSQAEPAATNRQGGVPPSAPSGGARPSRYLDFGVLASRTVRQYMYIVLTH